MARRDVTEVVVCWDNTRLTRPKSIIFRKPPPFGQFKFSRSHHIGIWRPTIRLTGNYSAHGRFKSSFAFDIVVGYDGGGSNAHQEERRPRHRSSIFHVDSGKGLTGPDAVRLRGRTRRWGRRRRRRRRETSSTYTRPSCCDVSETTRPNHC